MTISMSSLSPEAEHAEAFHGIPQRSFIIEEQPYHRQAALALSLGADTREVADALGVTPQAVRNWLKEPWFQQRVALFLREHGRDLTQLFAAEAFASLNVMVELRDSPKVSAAVRNNICQHILDRHLGKPTQHVAMESSATSDDPVGECSRLREENLRLGGTAQSN